MAYSSNILPKSAAYYTLSNATISGTELNIASGGFAEIQVSKQMLSALTENMLVVVHPSIFSSGYTNDAIQVTLSALTSTGNRVEYLLPVSYNKSGVFNTEITFPGEDLDYVLLTYRISSKIPVVIYNWELCAEEANDLTTIIEGVEQEIPRLLYDYNTYSYAIEQRELTVGLITCYLLDDTDLQGHFTLSFFATERCNVHVRIKDNGVTELFSPQVFTVEKGYSSISIPHAYLKKQATDHAFAVTVQCTNGQLSIPVRGLLYTIDGGYLATRLLDAGVDVEDISIRQVPADASPSEIWAVGFEGNQLVLSKRVYSHQTRANWSAVKDFGEGLKAAVEFPGRWISRNNSEKHTLETEEFPYVFILGTDKILRVYSGNGFDTITELDSSVTTISACQGFNSMYDIEQDQGLVIAYVKNGNVYYRQYLYNAATDKYLWYPAELLYDAGNASFVSIHRLPDYRMGVCVTYSSGTKWYITDRTYVSQAVKPEVINASTDTLIVASVFDADKAENIEWVATQNTFEPATWYNGFIMTFDGPLVFLYETTVEDFINAIKVSVNGKELASDDIKSVTVVDNVVTVQLVNDVRSGSTVTVSYNFYYMFMKAYNGSLAFIKQEYSWVLPIPTVYLNHTEDKINVSVSSAELDATVIPIITTTHKVTERITPSIESELDLRIREIIVNELAYLEGTKVSLNSTLSLTVTQVGVSPV